MKSETTSLDESTVIEVSMEQSQSTNQKDDVDSWKDKIFGGVALKCMKGNKGYGYCVDCLESSLLCSDQTCECYEPHSKLNCQNIKRISVFNKKLISKINDSNKIIDAISNMNQQMIDKISEFQDQIRKKFQTYGLNSADLEISHKIINYSQKNSKICSKDFIKYAQNYNQSQKSWFFEGTQFYSALISKLKTQINKKLDVIEELIFSDHMEKVPNKQEVLFASSQILLNNSQEKKYFFEISKHLGPIKKAVKIYSTSTNGFFCQQFLPKCMNRQNLVFLSLNIRDQNKRVFGGFSPVKFTQKGDHVYSDDTLKSFIFDLTHKTQARIVKKEQAVKLYNSKAKNQSKYRDYLLCFGNINYPSLVISENSVNNQKHNFINFQTCLNQSNSVYQKKANPKRQVYDKYSKRYLSKEFQTEIRLTHFQVFQLYF